MESNHFAYFVGWQNLQNFKTLLMTSLLINRDRRTAYKIRTHTYACKLDGK